MTYGDDSSAPPFGVPAQRTPVQYDPEASRLRIGEHERPVADPDRPESFYAAYLSLLYAVRGSAPGTQLPLRSADLEALLLIVGDDPDGIEQRLIGLMGCTAEEASALGALLLRHRRAVAAFGIAAGLAVGLSSGLANGAGSPAEGAAQAALQHELAADVVVEGGVVDVQRPTAGTGSVTSVLLAGLGGGSGAAAPAAEVPLEQVPQSVGETQAGPLDAPAAGFAPAVGLDPTDAHEAGAGAPAAEAGAEPAAGSAGSGASPADDSAHGGEQAEGGVAGGGPGSADDSAEDAGSAAGAASGSAADGPVGGEDGSASGSRASDEAGSAADTGAGAAAGGDPDDPRGAAVGGDTDEAAGTGLGDPAVDGVAGSGTGGAADSSNGSSTDTGTGTGTGTGGAAGDPATVDLPGEAGNGHAPRVDDLPGAGAASGDAGSAPGGGADNAEVIDAILTGGLPMSETPAAEGGGVPASEQAGDSAAVLTPPAADAGVSLPESAAGTATDPTDTDNDADADAGTHAPNDDTRIEAPPSDGAGSTDKLHDNRNGDKKMHDGVEQRSDRADEVLDGPRAATSD